MNKHFKKLFVPISIMLILTMAACGNAKNEMVETSSLVETEEQVTDKTSKLDNNEVVSPEMSVFLKMIIPDKTTAELKSYIEKNIQYVSQKEAERMIEFLLIYQTETIADFQIIEEFYNNIYDEIDETVLESMSDEKVKAAYKFLLDSSLKIKFNDYYSYVITDWISLKKFSPYLPEDYEKIFNLYNKIENQEYNPEEVDVTTLGKDIIKTETIIKNNDSSFLKKTANGLYESQLYNLLLGPEGSHVYLWSVKNTKEYFELVELSKKYPKSIFSKIINEIDEKNIEEISDITEIITKYVTFGIESKKYVETVNYSEGKGEYRVFQIKIPENEEKEKKINDIIKKKINNIIEEENINGNFSLNTYLKYADEKYISYEIYFAFLDLQGYEEGKYLYRTLDYEQVKHISLEEYFGVSFDSIRPKLERIIDDKIDFSPDYVMFVDEIHLLSYNQEGESAFLNLKDLLSLMH